MPQNCIIIIIIITSWSLNRVLYVSYIQEFYKGKENVQCYPALFAVKDTDGNQV